jgi:hypothetical protein
VSKRAGAASLRANRLIAEHWHWAAVVALAIILWVPRFTGPIDLRWDGGVYYLLGTSLASGQGYRIPSEPGSPQALQYPPLLPAFVALHQWVSGTANPAAIAPRLRLSYAALFIAYAVAILALARQYLPISFAVLATAFCILHHLTIFLSDLLFAELPFALVSVLFATIATMSKRASAVWPREAASFLLAAAGFLLKTIGVVLFAAWVLDAVCHRRWKLAVVRCALALVPILAWQAHVARVRTSAEYAHPAYEYQRAAYQYSNVTYGENASLLNPFRPELGRVNGVALGRRIVANLPWLMMAVGETLSAKVDTWPLKRWQARLLGRRALSSTEESALTPPPVGAASHELSLVRTYAFGGIPLLALAALAGVGLVVVGRHHHWLLLIIIVATIAIVWLTPWRVQFTRYLMPLMPFLTICAMIGFLTTNAALQKSARVRVVARLALFSVVALSCILHLLIPLKLFRLRADKIAVFSASGIGQHFRFFAHDASWQGWEEAADWIDAHTPREVIVATSAPHLLYLLTGRRAVLPPMELEPAREQQLLEGVPVSYVIVDRLEALDVTRRYVLPAVAAANSWQLVHSLLGTRVYERASFGTTQNDGVYDAQLGKRADSRAE